MVLPSVGADVVSSAVGAIDKVGSSSEVWLCPTVGTKALSWPPPTEVVPFTSPARAKALLLLERMIKKRLAEVSDENMVKRMDVATRATEDAGARETR